VSNDLTGGGAVRDGAGLARLTGGHVVQHILHRPTVRKNTLRKKKKVLKNGREKGKEGASTNFDTDWRQILY
jgi:hypothetical protein